MNNEEIVTTIKNAIITVFLPVFIIVAWFLVTDNGWVRLSVLPSPQGVWESAKGLIDQGIFQEDLKASLARIIKGFLSGASVGIVLGVLIGIFPQIDRATKLFIAIFRPIPIIALIPLFILWFGIGEASKVIVIALGTFWTLLINTIDGIKGVDNKLIELTKMLGKSRFETIRYVILPNALPYIFTGLRISMGASLGFVITSEMIAASAGIGYRIMFARNMALPGTMFVGIIEIGFFGLIIDLVLLKLHNKIFSYR